MRQPRLILIPLLLAYLSVIGGYVALQRKLIYHPVPLTGVTPKNFGVSYQDVLFTSADGVTLAGWWVQHPDAGHPVLLYCHGNADCVSQLAEVSKIFYDFSFDELIFDYRNYGGSGKGPLSEKALDGDALAAYQWIKDKGFKDGQIILWGHSLGSSVAAWLSTRTHPAGLILEGAFPSIYAVSRLRNPWLWVPRSLIWDKFETRRYVAERTCPLLETHAEKDTVIPIELGRKVFAEAAEPKKWLEIKGINHNDFPSVAYQYKEPIQEFVKDSLANPMAKAK
ncbi:MAG TPA: alpha/beta hydrolase [bacterium]|nr:alpha/beta hydrolase [bacterium]